MSEARIAQGSVVTFEYTLKNDQGEVLDASEGHPLTYLHGADNIVPGLERELDGKGVGDEFQVVVAPADGYGERIGTGPQPIDRGGFPPDAELEPGMSFAVETEGGLMPLWIVEVGDDHVMVDVNHPLAGVELHFSGSISEIRQATDEELEHGHVHGPDGHHH